MKTREELENLQHHDLWLTQTVQRLMSEIDERDTIISDLKRDNKALHDKINEIEKEHRDVSNKLLKSQERIHELEERIEHFEYGGENI